MVVRRCAGGRPDVCAAHALLPAAVDLPDLSDDRPGPGTGRIADGQRPRAAEDRQPRSKCRKSCAAQAKYRELNANEPEANRFDANQLDKLGLALLREGIADQAAARLQLNLEAYPDYARGFTTWGMPMQRWKRTKKPSGLTAELAGWAM